MKLSISLLLILFTYCTTISKAQSRFHKIKTKLFSTELFDRWHTKLIQSPVLKIPSDYQYLREAFPILYRGDVQDTLWLPRDNMQPSIYIMEGDDGELIFLDSKSFKEPTTVNLEIWVDTTKTIASWSKYIKTLDNVYPNPLFDQKNDSLKSRTLFSLKAEEEAYPVWLISNSNDTLEVGEDSKGLSLMLEIKNKEGDWLVVRLGKSFWFCGNGYYGLALPPKQVLLTTCPIYQGDTQTAMRLVFMYNEKIYSNEFHGWVDSTLFEKKKSEQKRD